MKRGYLKSSPRFFRMIRLSMALLAISLLALAALVPAPLQEPADLARVPNPVKSAWFLLWIQELVSYSKQLIYLVLALAAAAVALPWLARGEGRHAAWFAREQRVVCLLTLCALAAVCGLTLVAMFCRGENWSFVLPF